MTTFNYAIQTQAPSVNIFGPRIIESGFPTPKKALDFLLSEVGQSARVVRIVPQTGKILPQTDYINPQIPSKTMTTTQHTPGPWKADRFFITATDCSRPREVATTAGFSSHERGLADARLIAAAPELLEACRSALAEITHCQVTNYAHATLDAAEETLRAAIAKATGENQK